MSGVIAQYVASPADLIKVQIQMEGKRRLMGEPARYTYYLLLNYILLLLYNHLKLTCIIFYHFIQEYQVQHMHSKK